ncbi:MAG: sensor histidine kinase [Oscillospiraceae bacterium]
MKPEKMRYLAYRNAVLLAAFFCAFFIALGGVWVVFWQTVRLLWLCVTLSALFVLAVLGTWHFLYKPYKEVEKIATLFAAGYTFEGIFAMRYQVSPGMEKAIDHIRELVNSQEMLSASKRQAQYLALQNQINPHFLYNTLEGIRGEALATGSQNIALMTEALATFFRYTISRVENLVTLEEEIANVENYFLIQQYRFGKRLNLNIKFENEEDKNLLMAAQLPKLTLQPLVENAIVHGIEGKVGQGTVTIGIQGTGKRMLVFIRDDGMGMDRTKLDGLNQKLSAASFQHAKTDQDSGGIALVNVNNRIRLLFGEEYGLAIYSTPGRGTDVEVTLPLLEKDSSTPVELS